MRKLVVVHGHDTGRQVLVPVDGAVTLGRGAECSFQLHDPSVSRVHCQIESKAERLVLSDAGGRWGIRVNDKTTKEAVLHSGDRIMIGDTELLVEVAPGNDNTTLAPAALLDAETTTPNDRPNNGRQPLGEQRGDLGPSLPPRIQSDNDVIGLLGSRFLRFDIESLISSARSGAVFRAWDNKHDRHVALKIFWPHLFEEESEVRRFVRAMRTAIPLRHEHLVRVYTAGRSRGVCFTSSELVEGESADELIQRVGVCGMLDWRRVLRIAIQLAAALQGAAEHNMVHRNITPHNILIRAHDDVVKLNDLVFAKAIAGTRVEQITCPGELVGELVYMSPEQTGVDHPLDERSDIYSLGAALYSLLAGRAPFEGRTTTETINKIQLEPPTPPTVFHLSISPLFEGEVLRMLEKRPEDRHPSAAVLLHELRRVAKYENVALA
ncbi:MAG: protein kinase [Planctomycetaceae bacterium]|nr:protein kinase [Planctomycetales bacterium]MCB9927500.1 protein kinase [Planctomycetaceae bacterium]